MTNHDKERERLRTKSLKVLDNNRITSLREIGDFERDYALIEAMIAGLVDYQPMGFGAKVEELRGDQKKLQWRIDQAKGELELLNEVIAEKVREFR